MGGKALGFEAARLSRLEYKKFIGNFFVDVASHFGALMFTVIPAYRSKATYGDMDVAVLGDASEWNKFVREMSNRQHYAKNGKVVSIGVEVPDHEIPFQVDFIYSGDTLEQHKTAVHYYSYNDLGNLVGRLYHSLGYSYGHDGLFKKVYAKDMPQNMIGKLLVTTDTKAIHEGIGLDHDRFLRGFHSLEEIFEWVSSSWAFKHSIYLFENLNAQSRIRDRKRTTYNLFLEWCRDRKSDHRVTIDDQGRQPMLGDTIMQQLAAQVAALHKQWSDHQEAMNLFNGHLVQEWTGLEGKELGQFMKKLRETSLPNDETILSNRYYIKFLVMRAFRQCN